jgi:hypothetical protein
MIFPHLRNYVVENRQRIQSGGKRKKFAKVSGGVINTDTNITLL